MNLITYCNKIIECGLIFLTIFTPMAFGAVHTWAYSIMQVVAFFMCIVWTIKILTIRWLKKKALWEHEINSNLSGRNLIMLGAAPFLFVLLIVFQLIPLPPQVIKVVSPRTYELFKISVPDYDNPAIPDAPPRPTAADLHVLTDRDQPAIINHKSQLSRPLSLYPYATKTALLQLTCYLSIFFMIVFNFRYIPEKHRKQYSGNRMESNVSQYIPLKRLFNAIIISGLLVSLLAILQKITGTTKIFWLRDTSYASFVGPFINRNHFAGYVNLIIPLALAAFCLQSIQYKNIFSGLPLQRHLIRNIVEKK